MKYATATILLSVLSYASLGHAQTQLLRGGAGGLQKKEEAAHHRELGIYNPTFEGALNANCCDSTSTNCYNDKESYEELEGDNWYARSCEQACETRPDCTGFEIQKFSSTGYCTLWKVDIAYLASASNNNSDCYRKVTPNSPPIAPPENVVSVAPTFQGALKSLCCEGPVGSTYGCRDDPESYDRLDFEDVYDSSPCEAACNERDDCTGFEFLISESGCECHLWKVDIGSFSQPQWNNNACYRKVTPVSHPSPPSCTASISTDKSCYSFWDDEIFVTFTSTCETLPHDWVGLYADFGPVDEVLTEEMEESFIDWKYSCGNQDCTTPTAQGTVSFGDASSYQMVGQFRMHLARENQASDGAPPYELIASSTPFIIAGAAGCPDV